MYCIKQRLMKKQGYTRKQIDLPDDIKIKLHIMAIKSGKDLKNYIQGILIEHAGRSEKEK